MNVGLRVRGMFRVRIRVGLVLEQKFRVMVKIWVRVRGNVRSVDLGER